MFITLHSRTVKIYSLHLRMFITWNLSRGKNVVSTHLFPTVFIESAGFTKLLHIFTAPKATTAGF